MMKTKDKSIDKLNIVKRRIILVDFLFLASMINFLLGAFAISNIEESFFDFLIGFVGLCGMILCGIGCFCISCKKESKFLNIGKITILVVIIFLIGFFRQLNYTTHILTRFDGKFLICMYISIICSIICGYNLCTSQFFE